MKSKWLFGVLILVGILLLLNQFQIYSLTKSINETFGIEKARKVVSDVKLDFYVMSYCPYGNQAEEGIEPVYRLLKDKVEFNPHYVIYENYRGGGSDYCIADGKYCAMHGVQELNQGIREMCVAKYLGMDSYFDFVLEMNKKCSSQNADTCWENVASNLGLNVNKIRTCEQQEGVEIAASDFALNQQFNVRGSPTVFLNGQSYDGGRTPQDYLNAICNKFTVKPKECNQQLGAATAAATQGGCG